jgi:arginine decarboxylase
VYKRGRTTSHEESSAERAAGHPPDDPGASEAVVFQRTQHWGSKPMFVSKRIFLTKGVGRHREKLNSFEMALRDAEIALFNLVRVSSIFPPGCKIIPKAQGLKYLRSGEVVFCVMSQAETNEPHRLCAASIGIAIPANDANNGYLSEHHSFGQTDEMAGDYAEDLAAQMLATISGVEFDPETSYDERKETWRISTEIYRTINVTQSAVGDKRGWWTTVVAAAVLIP